MSAKSYTEKTIEKLRPEWAQLMANLVLRGWRIYPVEGKAGMHIFGTGAWTAHLEIETATQLEVALRHKDLYGLRMYTAPSLLSLLQQMQPVLAEFVAIESEPIPPPPDAASAAAAATYRNRTTIITVTPKNTFEDVWEVER